MHPQPTHAGLGHVTCFGQWILSKRFMSHYVSNSPLWLLHLVMKRHVPVRGCSSNPVPRMTGHMKQTQGCWPTRAAPNTLEKYTFTVTSHWDLETICYCRKKYKNLRDENFKMLLRNTKKDLIKWKSNIILLTRKTQHHKGANNPPKQSIYLMESHMYKFLNLLWKNKKAKVEGCLDGLVSKACNSRSWRSNPMLGVETT